MKLKKLLIKSVASTRQLGFNNGIGSKKRGHVGSASSQYYKKEKRKKKKKYDNNMSHVHSLLRSPKAKDRHKSSKKKKKERCYVYNIFTTNHMWLVVIGSNLKLTLRLLFCPNNNN